MAKACECNVGLSNTGTPNCQPIADVTKRLILVPYYTNAGAINEIDVNAVTFNSAFFLGKTQNADKSIRWFPTPDIENIEDVRADAVFESLNSGKNIFIQQGVRTFTGVIIKQSPEYLAKLESAGCVKLGAFIIDKGGNLIGNGGSSAGMLRPIKIDNNTFYPRLEKSSDTTIQKIQINFEWDIAEQDSNIRMVAAADMSYDLFNLTGLIDIYGETPTNVTTTGFEMDLNVNYGSMKNIITAKGLVLANFTLFNITDNAAVTITSVTESPDGHYAFAFAAQTSGDVLRLTVALTTGYDSTELAKVAITIP